MEQVTSSTDSEDDSELQNSGSSSDEDNHGDEISTRCAPGKQLKDVTVGDFILANLIYDEGTKRERVKQFVCQIVSASDDEGRYLCKFMRNYRGFANTFVFPVIDDSSELFLVSMSKVVVPQSIFR
ncbi:hypothetical protein PR048_032594 [Dryococelus australis]|uniref:Uncharacterized protein n=1 Tax=Dryococelus australis TaxID=614101 RepID=A0ABQ9G3F5_9NEOP|nr:hypothetical protein PR048_032594 [Dryococelus australis]